METEGHRALKYKLRRKAHSSWLTILISPLIHQIPHYVELLPGTLGSPSHTQYHRAWEAARPAMKEGHRRVRAVATMLVLHMHVQRENLHICR